MSVAVGIVGAGPVGLALAGDLGTRGVRCVVLDNTDGVLTEPRMELVNVRSMEFARRWGIAGDIEHCGYDEQFTQDYAWISGLAGFEFGREPFPSKGDELPPPQSPQSRERCPQDMLVPILQRFVARYPHVEVAYGLTVHDIAESADGVAVRALDGEGAERSVEVDYLVGCDGAASVVRKYLGLSIPETAALTYTNNLIFRCAGLLDGAAVAPAYRYIFIGPQGTWATLVSLNGSDRWRFSVVGDGNKSIMPEHELLEKLYVAVGHTVDITIESVTPWVRREWVAERYGSERVFLAGDSAHVMSPTGAFGMNSGMGDAVDLGWKLAARVQGWGGPQLLRSYELERRPVAVRNVAEATRNLHRMLSSRRTPPSPEVFDASSPRAMELARAYGQVYTETMRPEWFTLGMQLGYRYDDSPIISSDGSTPPPLLVTEYPQTSRPGARAPHVWIEDGTSTLDLFGDGFTLLVSDPSAVVNALVAATASRGVPLVVHVLSHPEVRAAYEQPLVLVRPDGHVAWRGAALPADCTELIDVVTGCCSADATDVATPSATSRVGTA